MRELNRAAPFEPNSSVTNFKDIASYLKSHPEKNTIDKHIGGLTIEEVKGHMEA